MFSSPLPFSVGAVVAPDVGGIARVAVEIGEVVGTMLVILACAISLPMQMRQ